MTEAALNPAIIAKVQKLLALAKDGGATEAEAQAAMDKAQAILAENNLSMATLEASGQAAGEGSKRLTDGIQTNAGYTYQRTLMDTIATVSFCHVSPVYRHKNKRSIQIGYTLIGREANVVTALNLFKYLNATLERLVTPRLASNRERNSRSAISFKEGCAGRLGQRLNQRFFDRQREQSAAARAQSKANAASGSNALVVVMEDFAQAEQDANEDFRRGVAPGTTAARRLQSEQRSKIWQAKEAERRAAMTPEELAKEKAESEKNWAKWSAKYERQEKAFWANRDVGAYVAGEEAADAVSLDEQVEGKASKRLN